jgi:ribosomal protection tetracycline resistance protein
MAAPVLRAQVVPQSEAALPALLLALERMHDETANLYPTFEPRSRRVHIRTMGEIHQQVLEQTLADEHGVAATLMPPEVLYRETPVKAGQGTFDMMMDPWKARATFTVEPSPRGGGVSFVSETHVDLLHIKYQKDIEKSVYAALREGLTGWPVTDITVRLTDGRGSWLSWGGASSHFGPVVPLGLFAALKDAGVRLLEPVYRFFAQADEAVSAALYYELTLIRAECEPPVFGGGSVTMTGLVPVGTSQRFAVKVNELTRGRGVWRTELAGYFPAPAGVGGPIARTTPDPANPSLYVDFITGRTTKTVSDCGAI